MKVLVTGGCGFVGANLLQRLLDRGVEITVLDNLAIGNFEYIEGLDIQRFIQADICDAIAVEKACEGQDAIIHLAAYGSVVDSVATPEENYTNNVLGTFTVLNAARLASVNQLIFASTGGALMGNAPLPVSEASVPKPISPYGASKLAGEGYCSAFASTYGMSITALRFANLFGPMSWHKKGAITTFFKNIMENKPLTLFGDGTSTRDYLYVTDLCKGILLALDQHLTGFNAFHLANGKEISSLELANASIAASGAKSHTILFADKRPGEVEKNFSSYALAQKVLGFKPKVTLAEGLEETWKWMLDYKQCYK